MENRFEDFFRDENYLLLKNHLFNYLNRKKDVKGVLKKIKTKDIILDIGCGVSPVVGFSDNVVFSDYSYEAMHHLRKKNNVMAVVSDISRLPFKDKSVDVVVSSEVLEHIRDDASALEELYRILKSGGSAVITVPVHKYYWFSDDTLVEHVRRYRLRSFLNLLKKTGFRNIEVIKIAGVFERFLTLFLTWVFRLKSGKKKNIKISKTFFTIYKAINRILANFIFVVSKITPMFLVSRVMVIGKK